MRQTLTDLELYLGQILSLYAAKSLGQSLGQIFCFIEGQILAQIKHQIVEQIGCVDAALMARTPIRIKHQNLNLYLEIQSTMHNIYFIGLKILPRNLVHYTGVWMTLYGPYTRLYKRPKFEL